MYIDDLIRVFVRASGRYQELRLSPVKEELVAALTAKKYDLQDEGLIEAIIRDDTDELVESYQSALEIHLGGIDGEKEVSRFLKSDEGIKETIDIFIASLEQLINLYYNNLIGKHFSSS